eukprot:1991161-Pleurochrysis_carterae.AAC.6
MVYVQTPWARHTCRVANLPEVMKSSEYLRWQSWNATVLWLIQESRSVAPSTERARVRGNCDYARALACILRKKCVKHTCRAHLAKVI